MSIDVILPVLDLTQSIHGLSWPWSYGSWIYNYIVPMQSVPITTNVVSANPA